jgi:single-stranded DNA-binding protein
MYTFQKVILLAVTRTKPTVRSSSAGSIVELMAVTVSRSKPRITETHYLLAFGRCAERMAGLPIGSCVYVEGHLETQQYTNKAGVTKTVKKIVCDVVDIAAGFGEFATELEHHMGLRENEKDEAARLASRYQVHEPE